MDEDCLIDTAERLEYKGQVWSENYAVPTESGRRAGGVDLPVLCELHAFAERLCPHADLAPRPDVHLATEQV
jgi:hypothetical protein